MQVVQEEEETMATAQGTAHHPGTAAEGLSYYDVIGALSTLECSQDVIFTPDELEQLTAHTKTGSQPQPTGFKRSKHNIHGYLGAKLNSSDVSHVADCDLSHTLMGGYVPPTQLETLCGTNFADLFHRQLDCSELLQVYDIFSKDILSPNMRQGTDAAAAAEDTRQEDKSTTSGGVRDPATDPKVYQWTTAEGKIIRKVVICRRCNSKFYGTQRLKQLQQHHCRKF